MTKSILKSKTKLGALLGGGAIVLGALGAYIDGALDAATAIKTVALGVGAILFGVGLRDAVEKN